MLFHPKVRFTINVCQKILDMISNTLQLDLIFFFFVKFRSAFVRSDWNV